MQEQFVPYSLAVRLKEINFHENCMAYYFKGGKINNYFNKYYNNNKLPVTQPFAFHCTAPLWQQAFDWFREKHNLYYIIADKYEYWVGEKINGSPLGKSKSYQKARTACLEKLIKIVENEKI